MNKVRETLDVLRSILRDGVDVHRCAAARALGEIGARQAMPDLIAALLDEDPDVRTDAAEALRALNDPAAAGPLMENLVGDPEADVKKAALEALIAFRHPPVLDLLRKLAVARTDDIAWDEDEFFSDGWDSWLDLQVLAIRGLAEFGAPEAVLDILDAMADEMGQDVSEIGVAAMARMGEDGTEALAGLFGISDAQLRRRIAEAVAKAPNPPASLVDTILADDVAPIRMAILPALAPDDPRLETLLDDPDPALRVAAISRAGVRQAEKATSMLSDPAANVRVAVLKLIADHPAHFPGEDLQKAVQKAISGDPVVARQAALALVALRGPSTAKGLAHTMTNTRVPLEFRVGAIDAMRAAGPASVPYLTRAIGADERQLRLSAMTALAEFAANDPVWPNAAGDALLAALRGELVPAPEVEEPAGDAPELARENADDVAEEEKEIEGTMPLVPEPGAANGSTLGAILSPTPAEPAAPQPVELSEQDERLLDLAKQRKMSKRKMSLEADVAPYLDVRRFAASLLGDVTNGDVTRELLELLDDADEDLREAALTSLAQQAALPAEAVPALTAQLGAAKSETRVLAIRALGRAAGKEAEAVLWAGIGDDDPLVRVEAVRALDGRGMADERIEACLQDSYPGVGIAAANSLARNRGEGAADALVAFAMLNDGTYRRDVGRLLGAHAREAGADRLIAVLRDDAQRRNWLVAIEALAEVLKYPELPEEKKVA